MANRNGPAEKIVWDDANASTLRPQAFLISPTVEEIGLAFAEQVDGQADPATTSVRPSHCIIMNPFVAKRLMLALAEWVQHHENRYGSIDAPDQPSRPDRTPGRSAAAVPITGQSPEKAALMVQLVDGLGVPVGHERSFKIGANRLLTNRFLQGVSLASIGPDAPVKVLGICKRIGMPDGLCAVLNDRIGPADYVHFGFEQDETRCVYKVYLEFFETIQQRIQAKTGPGQPVLMHLGLKWDGAAPERQVLTSYHWHPFLPVAQIHHNLSRILEGPQRRVPLEIARAIVDVASRRIDPKDIVYLEVTESGSTRLSFDINMYRADLRIAQLYPFLNAAARHYHIAPQPFETLYASACDAVFGHLSGGIDRQGNEFLTIYYGLSVTGGDSPEPTRGHRAPATGPMAAAALAPVHDRWTDENGSLLVTLANRLNIPVAIERSFKMAASTLQADRFLLGLRCESLGARPFVALERLCRQLRMPEPFIEAFARHLPEASIVLFGYEGQRDAGLYKAYLEFGDRIGQALREKPDDPDPLEIHMGFKWDPADPRRQTTTRYTFFPALGPEAILQRLCRRFYDAARPTPYPIVEAVLRLAAGRTDPAAVFYFEADEAGNPRTSFDLNLYMAKLRIGEVYPFLLEMVRHYGIADEAFHRVYTPIGNAFFGHLTGGTDRQGKDFLTVYHGEKASTVRSIDSSFEN